MTYAPTTNNDQSFISLGTVAASDDIKNVSEAFGYTVGYGGAVFVMATGTTMACSKSLKETSKPIS